MYCKYCGKQIDDDSKFCKECGSFLDGNTNKYTNYEGFFKKHFVLLALIVIWYIIGYIYSLAEYDKEESGILYSMFVVTPIIMSLMYWLYKQNCRYQIQLFNKADSTKIKLLKYAYLAYTYFIPFCCADEADTDYLFYFFLLGITWLVPTLIICGYYYTIQSQKTAK